MDKNTTETAFSKVVKLLPMKKICKLISYTRVDKYVKKLFTSKFLGAMIFAQINQTESIAALSGSIRANPDLQNAIKLESISTSQLSRRLKETDSSFWEKVFTQVTTHILPANTPQAWKANNSNRIRIIDASTITLTLSNFIWADYRSTKAGVKIHRSLIYSDCIVYPDKTILTEAKKSDKSQMDELLTTDQDALHAFDRGYVDYRKWDEYCADGLRFVTRLRSNAIINILEERTVDNTGITESIVTLGDPKTTGMKHKLRLIRTTDTQGNAVIILTNDLTMSALGISDAYRLRWQIELFFKWIKQHLKVKKFFGKSQNSVYSQIWLALITYCLLLMVKLELSENGTLLDIQRGLKDTLFKPYEVFLEVLRMIPRQVNPRNKRKAADPDEQYERLLEWIERYGSASLDVIDTDMNYL